MPNNLGALDPVVVIATPPEPAAGLQKVLIPRAALEAFEILGVVGSPLKKTKITLKNQLSMFD